MERNFEKTSEKTRTLIKAATFRLKSIGKKIINEPKSDIMAVGMSRLTFLQSFTVREIEAFISVLRDLQTGVVESKLWERFLNEKGLSRILFNRHLYDIHAAETMSPTVKNGTGLSGIHRLD